MRKNSKTPGQVGDHGYWEAKKIMKFIFKKHITFPQALIVVYVD